jgi:nucleotidyltransferase substrate binding protein (TIGR01987 family)
VEALRRSVGEADKAMPIIPEGLVETVRAGVIQHFEVAYEQCWKAMRRWIEVNVGSEAVDGVTRRELFRLAAESRLIEDIEAWMEFHHSRNNTSHTYDPKIASEVFAKARQLAPVSEAFVKAIGSRND